MKLKHYHAIYNSPYSKSEGRYLYLIGEKISVSVSENCEGSPYWGEVEQEFNTYFDILDKQYIPTVEDLEYISSFLEKKIELPQKIYPSC